MLKWRFKHWRCTSKCSHNKKIEDELLQCRKKSNLNSSIKLSFQETNTQETLKSEAATTGVLCKTVFFEISQNSQENTCARVSFLIKLQASMFKVNNKDARTTPNACNFTKKETLTQMFSCEFVKFLRTPILQNTFGRLLLWSAQIKKNGEHICSSEDSTN